MRERRGEMATEEKDDGFPMTERLIANESLEGELEVHEQHEKLDNATFAIILTTNSFDSADKSLLTPAFRVLVPSCDLFLHPD